MNKINHIFIFCDNHDEVAQEFIDFGFVEGSNRVHNVTEVTNNITAPTKLYERSKYSENGYSPFGLCLKYAVEDNELFTNAIVYEPTYLPKSMFIEVLTNEKAPSLPWTFRWHSGQIAKQVDEEKIREKTLTKVYFGVQKEDIESYYIKYFKSDNIVFEVRENISLSLEFNHAKEKKSYEFLSIPLSIEY